jgi:hypothetical protein
MRKASGEKNELKSTFRDHHCAAARTHARAARSVNSPVNSSPTVCASNQISYPSTNQQNSSPSHQTHQKALIFHLHSLLFVTRSLTSCTQLQLQLSLVAQKRAALRNTHKHTHTHSHTHTQTHSLT